MKEDITEAVDKVCRVLGTVNMEKTAERSAYDVLTSNAETERMAQIAKEMDRISIPQSRDYMRDVLERLRAKVGDKDLGSKRKRENIIKELSSK